MPKEISINGWISIVPTKMYQSWVEKKLIKPKQTKINSEAINHEVDKWYDEVFNYTKKWLRDKGYINLKQGSFDGGFCVGNKPGEEVVDVWGAPVENPGNKVSQIKEKFGYITVYFHGLTKEQDKEIEEFAKHVEKKFDCKTRF